MSPRELSKALTHLKQDKRLAVLIKRHPKPTFERGRDPFVALCRAIVGQQLSVKAAATIYKRFTTIYGSKKLEPKLVLRTTLPRLRAAGLSAQKSRYLWDLAKKFIDGTVDPKHFASTTDEAIRAHLVAVKGIGRWTADMFLMFTLHRLDVLPTGDLGIQKSMQKMFRLKKLPDSSHMKQLASSWRPYRTIACRYLWDSLDNE